jgi:hypothetical protein
MDKPLKRFSLLPETEEEQRRAARDFCMVHLLYLEDQYGTRLVRDVCAAFLEFSRNRTVEGEEK